MNTRSSCSSGSIVFSFAKGPRSRFHRVPDSGIWNVLNGAHGRIRTYNRRFRRPLLIQFSFVRTLSDRDFNQLNYGSVMVRAVRLELTTSELKVPCYYQLSYAPLRRAVRSSGGCFNRISVVLMVISFSVVDSGNFEIPTDRARTDCSASELRIHSPVSPSSHA